MRCAIWFSRPLTRLYAPYGRRCGVLRVLRGSRKRLPHRKARPWIPYCSPVRNSRVFRYSPARLVRSGSRDTSYNKPSACRQGYSLFMVRLFRVFVPVGSLALLISEVVLVTAAFVITCYFTLPYDPTVFLLYDGGLARILLVTASVIIGLHFHDLYTHIHIKSGILLLQQLSLVMGVAFLAQGLISYASRAMRMPIHLMVPGSAVA